MTWTEKDNLRLSVVMGLRKGLSLIRGMRGRLTHDQQKLVADEIIKHLEQSNWTITKGPPLDDDGASNLTGGPNK